MALADVYQLVLTQTFAGKELNNVFFFNRSDGAGGAGVLCAAFDSDYLPVINAMQSTGILNQQIFAFSLGNLSDFSTLPISGTGDLSGQALPPQDAISFSFKLNTRAIRPGGKRIAGIPESAQSGGQIEDAGYLDAIEDVRILLGTDLVGGGTTYQPVVVKRVKTAIPGTTPTEYTYRLPEDDDDLVLGGIVAVLTSDLVKSQVSRKRKV